MVVYFVMPDVAAGTGTDRAAATTAALLVLMATWWMTEALPLAATALLPLVVFPLSGEATVTQVAVPYASPVIFLFLGGFVLALAMQRWRLHLRVALHVVRLVGTRSTRLVLGFMIATAGLSMWVSNTATAVMMLPIGMSVLRLLGERTGRVDHKLAASLMLGIAYAATIGSFGTIIGSPPNALMVGYLAETYGIHIGFGRWMLVGVPLTIVFLALAWFVLTHVVFRTDVGDVPGEAELIREEIERLGPMGRPEKRVLAMFVTAAVSWVTVPTIWPGGPVTDEVIAILVALLLFLLPSGAEGGGRLLEWTDTRELPWGILLLFGGGLALASQITSAGLSVWLGERLTGAATWPPILLVAAVCLLTVVMTEFMSNTAAAATLLPITGGIAAAFGHDPLLLTMPVALAAACVFMMPAATPPNAIAYSSGYVKIGDMIRGGAPLSTASVLLVTATVYLLGGWVFGLVF